MVGFLLIVALVVIAVLLRDIKKLKCGLRDKDLEVFNLLKHFKVEIGYRDMEVKELKIKNKSLREEYEKEIITYKKAVEDGVSFKEAKLILEEQEKEVVRKRELLRQKELTNKIKVDAANRSKRSSGGSRSSSSNSSSNSSSSNNVWDDFDGGYRSSSSGSNSSSNSSYSGGGGDFGGGGSGGSWSD